MKKIGSFFIVAVMLTTMVCVLSGCGEDKGASGATKAPAGGGKMYVSMGYEVYQPANWGTKVEGNTVIITPPNYPTVADNIKVTVTDRIKNFSECTEDYYKTVYGKAYAGFNLTSYKTQKVNSHEAIELEFTYNLNGKTISQNQIIVDANSCYTFSFTDESKKNVAELTKAQESVKVA